MTKEGIATYLSQLHALYDMPREQQANVIKQFIRRVIIYVKAPNGGGRKIKIESALSDLLSNREDNTGGGPSPPSWYVDPDPAG
jgi:hypothetical protein